MRLRTLTEVYRRKLAKELTTLPFRPRVPTLRRLQVPIRKEIWARDVVAAHFPSQSWGLKKIPV